VRKAQHSVVIQTVGQLIATEILCYVRGPALEMGRYTIPELLFVSELHAVIYQYNYIHVYFAIFLTVYPCFAFKKCAGTSELTFQARISPVVGT
jgi:hypothetical protein